jgi:beta-glucosidase/6-phospho-beta-glucosidase/beta-galactosidase
MSTGLFRSFFLGGFECSTHRLRSGKRLDLIHSTRHDEFAASDYRLLQSHGILTARDGLRWTLIEPREGVYDFSSATGMLRAARETDMQVIWDLWHYGWPDGLDLFSPAFITRFVAFAKEAIKHISDYTDVPLVSPINEISFFSWAGGEGGIFNPFAKHRGDDVKRQLVRASIEAIRAMREINPAVRVFQIDPMINVLPKSDRPADIAGAEHYRLSQFTAWDMILGRVNPEFGGGEELIDVIGTNYYIHNQFVWYGDHSNMIVPSDPRYKHISLMLQEVYERYRRPIFVAETGIEDETRPAWLRYMSAEVYAAWAAGAQVEGICLYPIVNHPGWEDDRHCYNGLFDYADNRGVREAYLPLAEELARQQDNVKALRAGTIPVAELEGLDTSALDWGAHVMDERTEESRTTHDHA